MATVGQSYATCHTVVQLVELGKIFIFIFLAGLLFKIKFTI